MNTQVHSTSCECTWSATSTSLGSSGHRILFEKPMLKRSPFRSKIGRNGTFRILMHGVTAGWTSMAYGTSTPGHACPMVWSAGCTWRGQGQEGQRYFYPQSIISRFTTNCRISLLVVSHHISSLTLSTSIISSSSMHSSLRASCKCRAQPLLGRPPTTFPALTQRLAAQQGSTL